MKNKLLSFLCVIFVLCNALFAFSACNSGGGSGLVKAEINDKGELVLIYENGDEENLGVVVGKDGKDGKDGDGGSAGSVVITGEGSNVPAACAKGLRSSVSVVCNFTKTVQGSGYYPGTGGTKTEKYSSLGSGVIYQLDKESGSAFIITNYHVVYDVDSDSEKGISEDVSVYLYGAEIADKAIKATYVGGSLYYDIAVLYVENSDILKTSDAAAVELADSNNVFVGDTAIAIGNAKGGGISASVGIISVDSEKITMTGADEVTSVSFRLMRVDTAVNSGNSGGGVFDENGRFIGIVNLKLVDDGVENIGYAIPSSVASSVAQNIIDYCYETELERVQRAMLGITVITEDSKGVYNTETGRMSIVETVAIYEISSTSLVSGKLKTGDVLVSASLGDKAIEITRQHHIVDFMLDARVGDELTVTVLRGDSLETVTVEITEDCLTEY